MDQVSTGKIGKYEIIKVLGRGGMGEVILARDLDLDRRVAIKRPFKSAMEEGLARFQVEARAATLRHPNIPAVYEMGEQDGMPYIAMEFVEGEALDKIISSGRPLDLIAKLSIIEQVCSALGYAHEKGIIHRDIKPANVIVQPDGVAKIIDFGIAKIQDPTGAAGITQTSQIIGSLHYIAPERFKGEAIDGRSDIFSAGVMLYLLLTGSLPFGGGEATASYKIVNEQHTSLSTHLHDYPPALDGILEKALAKSPDDRYLTAEDFADALHEVIEDLKRGRVSQLFDDAERLTTESRYAPALELLDEAAKLDPANTQVRKLRKFVREHQERSRRAERLREFTVRADEALLAENYDEALNHLREAEKLDSSAADLKQRIQAAEDKKRRHDARVAALNEAEVARKRGNTAGALRVIEKAIQDDPESTKLLAARGALVKQAEIEALQGKVLELIENARKELTARHYSAVEALLREAESIDPSHPEIDKLQREVAKVREQEERRAILDEIHRRVTDFLRADAYDQAADLLNRAIERLPNEATLLRLKSEVEAGARKMQSKAFVDSAISQAKEVFASSPSDAIAIIQRALEQMPGEERLLAYERSLRQQLDVHRVEQLHGETLRNARELMASQQFDKAIGVLESFNLEFGHYADVNDLLAFAKDELANQQRKGVMERCLIDARAMVREDRLDDAVQLLESGLRETGDASLSRLLEEVKGQQAAHVRKLDLLQKKVALLRDRGDLDEAVKLLQEYLAETPGSVPVRGLLTALKTEQEHKRLIANAIESAREAARRNEFSAALESLQAVMLAYGESTELNNAVLEVQNTRAEYAQDLVGKSIETARAALLKNETQVALDALKSTAQLVEFADEKKQADWQRIGQSVKKALEDAGMSDGGTDFAAQLSVTGSPRRRGVPIWAVAVAGVALVAIGGVVWWKLQPPPASTVAHIRIAKAPGGATVTIDNGKPAQANATGDLTVEVKPGPHDIHVAQNGFQPFDDHVVVGAGETVQDDVSLTKVLPAGTAGTLLPQGNMAEFKLSVDGKNMGLHHAGQPVTLEVGTHLIRYETPDGSDSQDHTIKIAANQSTPDSFTLKLLPPKPTPGTGSSAPAVSVGKLNIQTNPGAQITIDGQYKGPADSGGNYSVQGLTAGQHTVDISLDKFQAVNRQVTVNAGQTGTLSAQLQAVAAAVVPASGSLTVSTNSVERGKPVQLSWQVSNASSISISGIGQVAPQGSRMVYPTSTTTYQLTANGSPLSEQTVNVSEPAAPTPAAVAKPKAAEGPDRAVLEQALNAYKSVFAQASGKNSKQCQSVFNGAYQGKLHALAGWCGAAKSFSVSEQCNQVGGSPEAPTLSCSESLTINTKDGNTIPPHPFARTFQFAKSPDGSWRVEKWE